MHTRTTMPDTATIPATSSLAAFQTLIDRRRSIRVYDQTPVPAAVIEQSLDCALAAPNSSNLQPWEFYWVQTPETKAALVQACFAQATAATAAELIVCVARTDTWRQARQDMLAQLASQQAQGSAVPKPLLDYYRKIVPIAYTQGPLSVFGAMKTVAFFVGGLFRPMPRDPTSHRAMALWAVKSTALACENFMLAVTAHGFDTCPMEGYDGRRVRRLLRLPRGAHVVMVISVGRRKDGVPLQPRFRRARGLVVKYI